MTPVVKFIIKQHIFPHRTLTHMTDLMTYPHKPHCPQITSVFKPSDNMVRSAEERFAMEPQLVQHPAPANPAELRALMTRVYHRTWAGSREMSKKIGNAWVRRFLACVASKSGFFEQHSHGRPHRTGQRHSARNTLIQTLTFAPQTHDNMW